MCFKENKNLFFNRKEPLFESQLRANLLDLLPVYTQENSLCKLYQRYIQNNKKNEQAYLHFYNRLSAKIDILKIIDLDQGKNIALAPSLVSKLLSLLTYSVELASCAILAGFAAATRYGVHEISDRNKIKSAKNKLSHLITDVNFIKLISIILTKTHERDFAHQEKLDYFLDKQFLRFWSLFKKQAKIDIEIPDLTVFWSTCLIEYFKELQCPLLKDNFERCLVDMLKTVNPPFQAWPQKLTEINAPYHSNDFNTRVPETIFLAQLILQIVASQYLNQLELIHTARIRQSSVSSGSTFWKNGNNNSREHFNQSNFAINQTFMPRLIASY
ncbi:MAG: hypothetical protein WAL30_01350 [Candidatus Aquirickettsiella sp.]